MYTGSHYTFQVFIPQLFNLWLLWIRHHAGYWGQSLVTTADKALTTCSLPLSRKTRDVTIDCIFLLGFCLLLFPPNISEFFFKQQRTLNFHYITYFSEKLRRNGHNL